MTDNKWLAETYISHSFFLNLFLPCRVWETESVLYYFYIRFSKDLQSSLKVDF